MFIVVRLLGFVCFERFDFSFFSLGFGSIRFFVSYFAGYIGRDVRFSSVEGGKEGYW